MKAILLISALLFPLSASAAHQVFGVRSDFSLDDNAPKFRDVYVNMGTEQGIKEGSVLDAFRTLTTVDEINQRTGQNISFRIAKLKVIHAEGSVAVARVIQVMPPETTPVGTYTNVMVGDSVEIGRK
jgi:hypothetical protein